MGDEGLTIHLKDPELRTRIINALSSDDAAVREIFSRAVRDLKNLPPTSD